MKWQNNLHLKPTQSNLNDMLIMITSHIQEYHNRDHTSSQNQNENHNIINLIFSRMITSHIQ